MNSGGRGPGATGIIPSPGEELLLVGLDASQPYWDPGKTKTKVVLAHGAATTTISGLFGTWTPSGHDVFAGAWSVPHVGYVVSVPLGGGAAADHRCGQDADL